MVTALKTLLPLPDWQRAGAMPAVRGLIRQRPEDFFVEELVGFEPDGAGEHDLLQIEKRGANTAWVAGQLARHAGIPEREVGFSGRKDRHAVTRQWFSVRRVMSAPADWSRFQCEGVDILEVARNSRKLRPGAHRANRFRILVQGLTGDTEDLGSRLQRMTAQGVPNYFGEQRFGRQGRNLELAEQLIAGKKLNRNRRSMALSAARSALFNRLLDRAVLHGGWNALTPGSMASLDGSASVFRVEPSDRDVHDRLAAFDIHPALPLWGRGRVDTEHFLEGLDAADIALARAIEPLAEPGWRAARLAVRNLKWRISDDTLHLSFTLVRGGFATAVLRELLAYQDASGADPSGSSST